MTGRRPALFLDRDDTINIDRVYINDPKLIELIPGAAQAIRRAQDAGYLIVVVSNQSGVGRGIIDPRALPKIHRRLDELLQKEAGASVDLYELCLHTPEENCDCRKPNPKLVLDAAKALNIDLGKSAFIGDKLTDVATGINAGCRASILIRTGKSHGEQHPSDAKPAFVADSLATAVDWFMKQKQ